MAPYGRRSGCARCVRRTSGYPLAFHDREVALILANLILFHIEQFYFKDKRGVGRDVPAGSAGTIAQFRRDQQFAACLQPSWWPLLRPSRG